jgi:hypothetical protein
MVTSEEYANIMDSSQLQTQLGMSNLQAQQQLLMQEQERGLAEEQLDVEEILDRIYNLLQGRELKDSGQGKEWVDSITADMKILSDWGIQRIMQVVRFHINKNTLLSNFDETQINRLMYDFTTELNDLVLLKYQQLFREPTFEECKTIIQNRLLDKEKIKVFANEALGLSSDKEKIREDLLHELEGRIEYEIGKIRDDERKEKIKEYGLLLWEIEQAVYSTLQRAMGGKERETLRRHANFTEVRALQPDNMQRKGGMFSWLKSPS